jgi:hypothetical protein
MDPVLPEEQPTREAEVASKATRRRVAPIPFGEYMCDSFYIVRSSKIWVPMGMDPMALHSAGDSCCKEPELSRLNQREFQPPLSGT